MKIIKINKNRILIMEKIKNRQIKNYNKRTMHHKTRINDIIRYSIVNHFTSSIIKLIL